jgi:hypothetical protein
MSVENPTTTPSPAPAPTQPAHERNSITIISHSNLFYWWPVWACGFIMAILTFIDGSRMAVVPPDAVAAKDADVTIPEQNGKTILDKREVLIMPVKQGKDGKPIPILRWTSANDKNSAVISSQRYLHMSKNKSYGVLFATVLMVVIVITNVPMRGMTSFLVILLVILLSVIFALAGWWETILLHLSYLDIRINAGGYLFISGILFAIWLFTFLLFDRQIYMVFEPGQFRVCTEIGGGEHVYDATGMTLEKRRSDLFRHWILGFGSGDLVVKTAGAQAHEFDLPNVLGINSKKQEIEKLLKRRTVIEARQ